MNPGVYLNDFVQATFMRRKNTFKYETQFDGSELELNVLSAKYHKEGVPKPCPRKKERGVDEERKDNLLKKLVDIVPPNRLQFWQNFPVSECVSTSVDENY